MSLKHIEVLNQNDIDLGELSSEVKDAVVEFHQLGIEYEELKDSHPEKAKKLFSKMKQVDEEIYQELLNELDNESDYEQGSFSSFLGLCVR